MEMESDEMRRAQSMFWQGREWDRTPGKGVRWEGMPANDDPEDDGQPWLHLIAAVLGFDLLTLAGLWACMYAPTVAGWWADLLQSLGVAR